MSLASRFTETSSKTLELSQKDYIEKAQERFRMKNYTPMIAPIAKTEKLSQSQFPQNELEREHIKSIPYSFVIGNLMYA